MMNPKEGGNWNKDLFSIGYISAKIDVPEFFSGRFKAGTYHIMNKLLLKYLEKIEGIPIGYKEINYPIDKGIIRNSFIELEITAKLLIFHPKRDKIIVKINRVTTEHVGFLIFNALNGIIPYSELEREYNWDPENNTWVHFKDKKERFEIGDNCEIKVLEVRNQKKSIIIIGKKEKLEKI